MHSDWQEIEGLALRETQILHKYVSSPGCSQRLAVSELRYRGSAALGLPVLAPLSGASSAASTASLL